MTGITEATDALRLLDDQTFEVLDIFKLNIYEMACSTASVMLSDDGAEYFAVGTAFVPPEELEPSKVKPLSVLRISTQRNQC